MIESLPTEITDVFRNFITTEYVTVDAQGQPIAWPVTPYVGEGTLDVTTGIGYPKKADDAARHPSIAMLYSDPTGSGMDSPPQVLVQGTAQVDEADLRANRERYRRESAEKLPAAQAKAPPKFVEGLFAWYFDRLYVKLTPSRVIVWPGGDAAGPPEVFGEPLPEATVALTAGDREAAGGGVWDERMDELGSRYSSAVLAWTGAQGFPFAARLPVTADAAARRIVFGAEPAGVPVPAGLACVTAHRHAEEFTWQENFQVRGEVVRAADGLALVPRKLVGGFELPDESPLAVIRRNFKKARRFHRVSKERRAARPAS